MSTTEMIITVVCAVLGSSGLSSVMVAIINRNTDKMRKQDKREKAKEEILLALAREQLIKHYNTAKERGYITHEEDYEFDKLFDAYSALGGNGTAEKVKAQKDTLEVKYD